MPIKFINGPQYMYIGDNVCIHPYVRLEAIKTSKDQSPIIKIGDRCALGYNTQINACNRIEIGSDVLFGSNVYITDHYHGNMSIEETSSPPTFVKYIRKVRL